MWRRGLWGVVRVSEVVGFVLITSTLELFPFLFLFIACGVLRIIRLLFVTYSSFLCYYFLYVSWIRIFLFSSTMRDYGLFYTWGNGDKWC